MTAPSSPFPLLPQPRRMDMRAGRFELRPHLPIVLSGGASDGDFASAVALRESIWTETAVRLDIECHARTGDLGPRISLHRDQRNGQAYRLSVCPERVELIGQGPAGLRYAVETLAQLVEPAGVIPACEIDDAPDLEVRGILIDISRGKVPTMDTLRGLVDWCVRLKLNALMLYTEHTFRFRRHPDIGRGATPLTSAMLRELDTYAAARHVELIPTLQSLGHMSHILGIPIYRRLAESERLWTISPAEPDTYRLLRDLYDEYLPIFRSRFFNANCDEPVDLGDGKSAALSRELGPGGVYLRHIHRVQDLVRHHGKRTMIWADVVHAHPQRLQELDPDLVLLDWWYESDHDYDRVRVFPAHGLDFLVCPGTSSWNALFPRVQNSLANISGYVTAGKRHGARGLIITDWGDGGHYNLMGYSWFAFAWGAQEAWSGNTSTTLFDTAFSRVLFGDATGAIAHIYRRLGSLHEAGFDAFNASPLQCLYFDDLELARFTARSKAAALKKTLSGLQRVRRSLAARRKSFVRDAVTHQELRLAVDASILAAEKGLAGLDYVSWRRRPARWRKAGRTRLADRLARLARRQTGLGRELKRLWLKRNHLSNFQINQERLSRSVTSLRRAAGRLRRNQPPEPVRTADEVDSVGYTD